MKNSTSLCRSFLIAEEYKASELSIYSLSKKYNVPINGIKNYFNRNYIKWETKNNKKSIIQMGLDSKPIKEWESGNQIKNELKFNSSAISECCRGIRKSYKGFIWKFK